MNGRLMNEFEKSLHLNIRQNWGDPNGYSLLADWYEDNNLTNDVVQQYLRLLSQLLEAQQKDIEKLTKQLWELVISSDKFKVIGIYSTEDEIDHNGINLDNSFIFNFNESYFYALNRTEFIPGIRVVLEEAMVNLLKIDPGLFLMNKYSLLKRYIVLNPLWHLSWKINNE